MMGYDKLNMNLEDSREFYFLVLYIPYMPEFVERLSLNLNEISQRILSNLMSFCRVN